MKTFRLPPEWGKKISGNAVSKRIISRTPVLFNCSRLHPRDPLSLSLCVCVCLKWKWKREGERYPSPFTISSEPRQRSPSEGLKGAHPSLSLLSVVLLLLPNVWNVTTYHSTPEALAHLRQTPMNNNIIKQRELATGFFLRLFRDPEESSRISKNLPHPTLLAVHPLLFSKVYEESNKLSFDTRS